MPELEITEKSRQMLVFTHSSTLRRGRSNLEQLPQNFQHPKDSAGPKSPTPVFLPIKSPTAFLFLPPRELPNLTAAAARAEQHQSSPLAFRRCQGP